LKDGEYHTIEVQRTGQVARITLDRPEVRNAFNDVMIGDLTVALERVEKDDSIRVVVLTGGGTAFCAGADVNWMKKMKDFTREENLDDALRLADLMYDLYSLSKPTIACVNGASIGGSNGLVAACDIVIASDEARFSLSEVKIGLVPACIGPYLMKRIGEKACRELFLTGERISAGRAKEVGLVNEVVPHADLPGKVEELVESLLTGGPNALAVCKEFLREIGGMSLEEAKEYTARVIADLRSGEEAQEGMAAFLEKRGAKWIR